MTATGEGIAASSAHGVDGRAARAERSRRQVVEAMIDLVEAGDPDPRAQQVADRAGVSLRTVFHHFQSMESVFTECWKVQVERHWADLRAPAAAAPLAARTTATVEQRTELFERIAAARRAGVVWARRSPVLARGLEGSHRALRGLLAETFAPELDADDDPAVLLDALDAATCFEAWDLVRSSRGPAAAAAAMARSLHALLAPTIPTRPASEEDPAP